LTLLLALQLVAMLTIAKQPYTVLVSSMCAVTSTPVTPIYLASARGPGRSLSCCSSTCYIASPQHWWATTLIYPFCYLPSQNREYLLLYLQIWSWSRCTLILSGTRASLWVLSIDLLIDFILCNHGSPQIDCTDSGPCLVSSGRWSENYQCR